MFSFEYCYKNLEELGEGSSRVVFALDDEWVLKLPITYGGYWQNQNEINFYKKYQKTSLPLCPIDLSKSSENFIVMRRAKQLSDINDDFKLYNLFDYCMHSYIELCENDMTAKEKNEFFKSEFDVRERDPRVLSFIKNLNRFNNKTVSHILYDVCSFNSGLINDQIVAVDYGYPEVESDMRENHSQNTIEYNYWLENN